MSFLFELLSKTNNLLVKCGNLLFGAFNNNLLNLRAGQSYCLFTSFTTWFDSLLSNVLVLGKWDGLIPLWRVHLNRAVDNALFIRNGHVVKIGLLQIMRF